MQAEAFAAGGGQNGHIRHDHDHIGESGRRDRHADGADDRHAGRRRHGFGRSFDIRLSDRALSFLGNRDELQGDGQRARRSGDGPREGAGERSHQAFGRLVSSFVREGLQAVLRALGTGETAASTTASDNAAVGNAANPAPASSTTTIAQEPSGSETTGQRGDILSAFSERLTQVVRQGLQTMFHLLGFGDKPEAGETEASQTSATDAAAKTSAAASKADTDAGVVERKHGHRHGHHGFEQGLNRFARFLAAGFMLAFMAEGLRSLKDLLGGDGSEAAAGDAGSETGPQAVTEPTTAAVEEAATIDIAA